MLISRLSNWFNICLQFLFHTGWTQVCWQPVSPCWTLSVRLYVDLRTEPWNWAQQLPLCDRLLGMIVAFLIIYFYFRGNGRDVRRGSSFTHKRRLMGSSAQVWHVSCGSAEERVAPVTPSRSNWFQLLMNKREDGVTGLLVLPWQQLQKQCFQFLEPKGNTDIREGHRFQHWSNSQRKYIKGIVNYLLRCRCQTSKTKKCSWGLMFYSLTLL